MNEENEISGSPLPESDLDVETPVPQEVLAADAAVAPIPTPVDPSFDNDSDFDQEPVSANPGSSSVFSDDHWTQDNVQGKDPITKPLAPGVVPPAVIRMPSMSMADTQLVITALEPVAAQLSPAGREWAQVVQDSISFLHEDGQFSDSLKREGSKWTQVIEHEGVKMTASVPVSDKPAPGTKLVGTDADIQLSRVLGTYARMMFPLWHSGLWLNVAVPSGNELHDLETQMATAKYDLGWISKGLAYSNTMVLQNITFLNFILDRVVGTNVDDSTVAGLKRYMRITDLNPLAGWMSASVYPSGFPLERPCSANPLKCHEVTRDTLRLTKIVWNDSASLSPEQLKHMQPRLAGRKKTADDMQKYQDGFSRIGARVVELKPGLSVRFLPPTIEQYEQSGFSWIDQIEKNANSMLATMSEAELNKYMTDQYQLTAMRQYAHWVEAIVYPDDVEVVDRESINNSLKSLSTEDAVVEVFMAAVRKYIDDCTITVVAINNYTCPKCNKSQAVEKKNPRLIPIDAVHTFFTLSGLKTQITLSRNMAF
jgi:hypothetical protein